MSKSVLAVFAWFLIVTQVYAALQKFTIYEKPDQNGDSITFTNKYPNLTDWKFFLNKAKSYCAIGERNFLDLLNFGHNSTLFGIGTKTERCGNDNFASYNSGRFLGPEDFDTPAISLYEGSDRYALAGREYLVTGTAGNGIPFAPHFALSFGNSTWTLFPGKDFDGNSTCLKPTQFASPFTGWTTFDPTFVVQSVAKGCDTVEVAENINIFKNSFK